MIATSLRRGFVRVARALGFAPNVDAIEPSAPPPGGAGAFSSAFSSAFEV